MKAMVTGGAGFIGSNLVDRLIAEGHEVVVIDNESSDAHDQFYWNPSAQNYKHDINNYDEVYKLYEGVDTVFHLAAEARIQPCIENPIKAVRTNILGTANVLECSRRCGVKRIIYSSTSSAYGLKNNSPLIETMPNDCLNPYSVTKVSGESLCKMYSSLYGLQTVIFRYFNVYGERQPLRGQYAPVTGIFLLQHKSNQPLTIVGDGEQRRDFVYVKDVVEANILASIFTPYSDYNWGQIYNIGTGKNHSVNEIAKLIGGETINIAPRLGEARITLANSNKAKDHFGWNPQVRLEDWISQHK